MIDPDDIILADKNENTEINIDSVPDIDIMIWDLEDEKEINKFHKVVENEVRHSYEYREFIQYLKDNFGMDQCSFIKTDPGLDVKIEIHHYPLTLYDIVVIVHRKRVYYQESLDVQMVAKEVALLHYKLLIGLIPLSKTVHQLVHEGKLFIPIYNVLGRWRQFINIYKQFCDEEQLETIQRIEEYSSDYSDIQNTSILDVNRITVASKDPLYQRPDMITISSNMTNRIAEIKDNNYRLPTLEDKKNGIIRDSIEDRKSIIKPIHFIDK